jgi:NAD(P)-dependent dehydrogenase (short-subunit alcohol dehydrogenase family)
MRRGGRVGLQQFDPLLVDRLVVPGRLREEPLQPLHLAMLGAGDWLGVGQGGQGLVTVARQWQLAVNHLGHFALTAQLLPALLRSSDARVVSVTSTGRHAGRPLDPDNPHLHGRYDSWRAYGQSKLANLHYALELDRRFRAADVPARSIIVHPGFTNTDLQAAACARAVAAAANGSSTPPSSASG